MKRHTHHSETKAVRGAADLEKKNGPLATPIYQTSTFEVTDNDEQLRATHTDHFYTRYGNPTNMRAQSVPTRSCFIWSRLPIPPCAWSISKKSPPWPNNTSCSA